MDKTKRRFLQIAFSTLFTTPLIVYAKPYLYGPGLTDSQSTLTKVGEDSYLIDGWVLTESDVANIKD